MTLRAPPEPLSRTVALLLAFVGGYADAGGFLLTRSFAGAASGNTVLLALSLVAARWREALPHALAVIALFAGVTWAEAMENGADAPHSPQRLPLALEGGLILAAVLVHRWPGEAANLGAIACLCLALGLQNGSLRRCGGVAVHTTFITGMGIKLISLLLRRDEPAEQARQDRRDAAMLAGVWVGFLAGALGGGFLVLRFPSWGMLGVLAPLAGAWAMSPRG